VNLVEYLMTQRDKDDPEVYSDENTVVVAQIKCKDGFRISVQASCTHYCNPRTNVADWTSVECGFPSSVVPELMEYAENSNVYGYVPVEVVEKVIESHGGMIEP